MKRYIAFFLSIMVLEAMTACGRQPAANSSPSGEGSSPVSAADQQIPEQGDEKPADTKDPEQTSEQTPEQAADEGRSRGKQPAPTQQQDTAVEKYLKW